MLLFFMDALDNVSDLLLPVDSKEAIKAGVAAAGLTLSQMSQGPQRYRLPTSSPPPATAGSWDKARTQSWHGAIPSLYAIANALKAQDAEVIGGLVSAGVEPDRLGELIADPSRQAELLAQASKLDRGDPHLRRQAAGSRDERRPFQPAAQAGRGAVRADADLRRRAADSHHRRDHLSARRHLGEGEHMRWPWARSVPVPKPHRPRTWPWW